MRLIEAGLQISNSQMMLARTAFTHDERFWIPAFAGMTTMRRTVRRSAPRNDPIAKRFDGMRAIGP
jgi:hypothetical protein